MAAVRHLGFVFTCISTIHEQYLLVFVTVHNVVGIGAGVSIIWQFLCFASLASKCLFMPLLGGFWGIGPPRHDSISTNISKDKNCSQCIQKNIMLKLHIQYLLQQSTEHRCSASMTFSRVMNSQKILKKNTVQWKHMHSYLDTVKNSTI